MWHPSSKTLIEYEGQKYSLKGWCAANGASYEMGLRRWHDGVRDPVELIYGVDGIPKMKKISDADVEYLKKTRFARKGQKDEWEIACDLIAQPHIRIPEIRKLVSE